MPNVLETSADYIHSHTQKMVMYNDLFQNIVESEFYIFIYMYNYLICSEKSGKKNGNNLECIGLGCL